MTKQNYKKVSRKNGIGYLLVILTAIFIFSGSYANAAVYLNLDVYYSANNLPVRTTDRTGSRGCVVRDGDVLETCDVEPGSYMTADGTLSWGAGFPSPLPAMGMGLPPGSGYIPSGYPLNCAAGSSYPGTGPGNSFSGGFYGGSICEITFNSPVAGSGGTAWYHIYVAPDAVRGQRWLMGLASNGGSNTLQQDFYVRVKPLRCVINSFTCLAGTLSWASSNCTSATIDNSIGSVPTSGSTSGTGGITYRLTTQNAESDSTSTASCPAIPTLNAYWDETGTSNINKAVSSPGSINIPFTFKKVGSGSLRFSKCRYTPPSGGETVLVNCPTPVGAEISN